MVFDFLVRLLLLRLRYGSSQSHGVLKYSIISGGDKKTMCWLTLPSSRNRLRVLPADGGSVRGAMGAQVNTAK